MARGVSSWLFFFLTLLTSYCSGTLVGFSYYAGDGTRTSSLDGTISFLEQNKVSQSQIRVSVADHKVLSNLSNKGLPVDLYLNQSQADILKKSKSTATSWLKTNIITFLGQVNIESIVAISSNDPTRQNELPTLLSTLKSIHSVLTSSHADRQVKVSVAFSLSFLESLSRAHERQLQRILNYIKKVRSCVIVEASIDGEELRMGSDWFVQSIIERANLAASILACKDVPLVLTIKGPAVLSANEVAELALKVSKALENKKQITGTMVGIYAEVTEFKDGFAEELQREKKMVFPSFHRELDAINPPTTIFPTTPIPPDNPTPTIVTVPSTVTITPNNPTTPVAVPSTAPITVPPPTDPSYTPQPITNPVTAPVTVPGAQPITNPVTTYPAPPATLPVTTPVTNPVAPPATTNAPAVPGASWCVAKSGASETALQSALDYACGMGGADCSQIQQGGSCYNPNSLQNHASFAFNSYYQKNPAPTSCDFGGTATIVNANPSTGSCVYPSSSSSSSSTPSTQTPTTPSSTSPTPNPTSLTPTPPTTMPPPTTMSPPTTIPPPSGSGSTGYGSPPSSLNSSNPASGSTTDFGGESPPGFNTTSTSESAGLRPFSCCIFLITSFVTRNIVIDV